MINVAALHYNRETVYLDLHALELMVYEAKYWDKPEQFRPERFMRDYNRDAFMPFAGGPRACIGRR
jgi:cytochrome P450